MVGTQFEFGVITGIEISRASGLPFLVAPSSIATSSSAFTLGRSLGDRADMR